MSLNDKGQCCGKKPLTYKRDGELFCPRCDRAYNIDTNQQIDNWAWKKNEHGSFVRVR